MSGGIFDPAGYPILRQDSKPIYTAPEFGQQTAAQQDAYQGQINGLRNSLIGTQVDNLSGMFANAGFNFGPNYSDYLTSVLKNQALTGTQDQQAAALGGQDYLAHFNAQAADWTNQAKAAQAAADQAAQERIQNQQVQQTAYNSMFGGDATGGGLLGGVLPTTATQASTPPAGTTTSGFGTSGMMSSLGNGFGSGAVSNLGLGSVPSASGSGGRGWGGPFSYRNPWAFGA